MGSHYSELEGMNVKSEIVNQMPLPSSVLILR